MLIPPQSKLNIVLDVDKKYVGEPFEYAQYTKNFEMTMPNGSQIIYSREGEGKVDTSDTTEVEFYPDGHETIMSEGALFKTIGDTEPYGFPSNKEGMAFDLIDEFEEEFGEDFSIAMQERFEALANSFNAINTDEPHVINVYNEGVLEVRDIKVSEREIAKEFERQMALAKSDDKPESNSFSILSDVKGRLSSSTTSPTANPDYIEVLQANYDLSKQFVASDLDYTVDFIKERGLMDVDFGFRYPDNTVVNFTDEPVRDVFGAASHYEIEHDNAAVSNAVIEHNQSLDTANAQIKNALASPDEPKSSGGFRP